MRLTTIVTDIRAEQPWARTDEPLIWLVGSGHETITRESGYFYDCRRRDDHHLGLQLTLSGEGFYERAGRSTPLTPGRAFFDVIPGDFRYGYPSHAREPYEQVWLDLQGPTALKLWQMVRAAHGPVIDLGADNALAAQMLAIAHEHAAGMLADRYHASARLYEVLMTIASTLTRTRVTTSPLVGRAIGLIQRKGLRPDFDVAALARELGYSREHLARTFVAATGVAPKAYLIQHRLRQAQRDLRDGNRGLEEIARRCGFAGANYFCRAFRSHFGLTPGAWRAQPWLVRLEERE